MLRAEREGIGQQCLARQCLLGWGHSAREPLAFGVPGVGMNVPTTSVSCRGRALLLDGPSLPWISVARIVSSCVACSGGCSCPHLTQFRIGVPAMGVTLVMMLQLRDRHSSQGMLCDCVPGSERERGSTVLLRFTPRPVYLERKFFCVGILLI